MIHLLLVLFPIALIDSISPVRIGAMVTILCADRPVRRAQAFIVGIFVGYFLLGLAFAFFGQRLLEIDLILDPTRVNFVIGLVIGVVLLIIGGRGLRARSVEGEVEVDPSKSAGGALVTALVITVATAPSAVPLLAGINQILKSQISVSLAYLALVFYCAVYLTPLVVLLVLRVVLGERAETVMKKLGAGAERWMGRLMAALFILLGSANVIDALGYFLFNRPLF
ncbi:MAG: GAP family protein [Acidobacteria bacterium]|uniref:GAP family protein n=1 Tax=Candidatus Sulfomarinibacter kjeldsenii TaxID=2885994 RepID=A0A8J6XWC1_9BACT|nr:GAP family protein [Candidatus Sulfomarinibacter kjeldsenii]MBD3857498.1 GAP family protein [Candidatus Sulfomarinibacter kjeldsenii]MBD3869997.1 GAP family protein [Candidatus Sulfomarinibacter kjeldsenii]